MEELTASANYLPEPDENGKPRIDPDYYRNIINDHITAYMQTTNTERKDLDGNDLIPIFRELYRSIFKPERAQERNKKCNIPYTEYNMTELLNVYVDISTAYKVPPSLFGFSILTGISEDTTMRHLTLAQSELVKLRKEMLSNKLYNERIGIIGLANHDPSFGLEWEKKTLVTREQIRQLHTANELPQLKEMQ